MNKYKLRKNYVSNYFNNEEIIRGKLAFKTEETLWVDTDESSIVLISIHSLFHSGSGGYLKLDAFLSTIKNNVKGKLVSLLADTAHLHTLSLDFCGNISLAFNQCMKDSDDFLDKFRVLFEKYEVVYWHSFICSDPTYKDMLSLVKRHYETDSQFQKLIIADAENTYTSEREKKYHNRTLFIEKGIEDILEQCASILVLVNKGYRFIFYPGAPYNSVADVSTVYIPKDKHLSWINVCLTIEKKTKFCAELMTAMEN